MLDKVNLHTSLSKEEYKTSVSPLKNRLSELQHRVKDTGLPVVVLFEGWDAAGKGSVLADVILTLDPRNFVAKNTLPPNCVEEREPFLWRHWCSVPPKGEFALYDQSWYPEIAITHAEGLITDDEAQHRAASVNMFERQMYDDGVLIIKFFLHIGQEEQKARLEKLAKRKATAWRVTKADLKRNRRYSRYCHAYDEMLKCTNTQYAPWHVVPAHDRRATMSHIYLVLVAQLEAALALKEQKTTIKRPTPLSGGDFTLLQMPELKEVDLSVSLPKDEYKQRLKDGLEKLAKLHNILYQKKIPVIIVYEGWDAAGKGGNIKRLTSALDPRGYQVVPIASPTPPEKARQHLWRFWMNLPKDGHIAIFDRSWYGRVLVERIEGFADEAAWHRAYRELNEFEAELAQWGAIILKFWLHIDKDEQLRRFEARKLTPDKQWKLTDEDWRNREKWDAYEQAVNDMVRLTSTDFAPWAIVESQDKRYGRIKTIEKLIEAIEARV